VIFGNPTKSDWIKPDQTTGGAAGNTNALECSAAGSYWNIFSPIFTATNTVGTTTKYLDLGAATNVPSLFYRVRLVP
jgi:hypothetical protein